MTTEADQTTKQQLAEYASIAWEAGDIIELRPLPVGKGERQWIKAEDLPGHVERLEAENANGANLYAGICPRNRVGGGSLEDVDGGRVVWADFDGVTVSEAIEAAELVKLPFASMVVSTGHGAHLFWKLDGFTDAATIKRICKGIAATLQSDPSVAEPARILRLPGFTNHKPPVAQASLLYADSSYTYAVSAFDSFKVQEVKKSFFAPSKPMPVNDRPHLISRARAYLLNITGSIPGGRTNTAFRAACVMVNDMTLTPAEALPLLSEWDYNANTPPIQGNYPEDELHKIINNALKYAKKNSGCLNTPFKKVDNSDIDISAIINEPRELTEKPREQAGESREQEPKPEPIKPPKDIKFPRRLLKVPGLIGQIAEYTLNKAAVPNKVAALAGAITMQAMLAGRKVRFNAEAETRTNLYLIVLAGSSAGKNAPRETNLEIISELSERTKFKECEATAALVSGMVANKFASGQGIVKAVQASPAMLFQVDEIDKLMANLSGNRTDSRTLEIEQQIMELYSSSRSVYFGDKKANDQENITINQPNMCILGTATPGVFFDSLSADALRNGFVGRILAVEAPAKGKRPTLKEKRAANKKETPTLPASIVDAAEYWLNFRIKPGQPKEMQGDPLDVDLDDDAVEILDDAGAMAYAEYTKARKAHGEDCPDCAVWGRFAENRNKLALIYACSQNAAQPHISKDAATWACEFAEYCCRLLIKAIYENVTDNKCHKLALRIKKNLVRLSGDKGGVIHSRIRRAVGVSSREFNDAIQLLLEREEVSREAADNVKGSPSVFYKVIR